MGLFDKLIGGGKRREFGEKLVSMLSAMPEIVSASFNEASFELKLRDSLGSYNAPLDEVFKELQNEPEEEIEDACQALVRQLVRFTAGVPNEFAHAKEGLMPYVRERIFYDVQTLRELITTGHEPFLPRAELADSLGVDLVWQSDTYLYPVTAQHYEQWGVEFSDAMSIAVHNMQKYRTKRWTTPQARVYVSPWRTPFDASMILFDEWITDLRVIGDPVVMVPTQETMIVTGSSDLAGLTAMADMVEGLVAGGAKFLSLLLYTVRDKEVVPFELPASHNLANRFRTMALETQMRDYTSQKEGLDEWFAANGKQIMVADYAGMENPHTREVHSYCIWPAQAKPVMLPKTDRIYFVDDPFSGRVTRQLSWNAVMNGLPGALEELNTWPQRFQVEGYPDEDQFRACVEPE